MKEKLGFTGELTCAMSVSTLEESIKWFQENLDFKLIYKMEEMGWCEMETPVQEVRLGLSQVEKFENKGGVTMTFGVTDIEMAKTQLEEKGVKFDGDIYIIEEFVKLATFFDPDGNSFMLFQGLSED